MSASPTSPWQQLEQDVENKLIALKNSAVAGFEAIEHAIEPIVESVLNGFVSNFLPMAVDLVLKAAQGEMAALTGGEKQSYVVTQVMQQAQIDGHNLGTQLRTGALTTAQTAYNIVATKLQQIAGS